MIKTLILISCLVMQLAAEESIYQKMLKGAIKSNNKATIQKYIDKGADVNKLSVSYLANVKLDTLKFLVNKGLKFDNGKDCSLRWFMNIRDYNNDYYETIKLLIDNGANVNCQEFNFPVLHWIGKGTSNETYIKTYELLLKSGADKILNKYYCNDDYYTRCKNGLAAGALSNKKIRDLVIKYGYDINLACVRDKDGKNKGHTPLTWAAFNGASGFLKDLVKKGADVNLVVNGKTAIDYAHQAKKDYIELFLFENGAKYNYYKELNSN